MDAQLTCPEDATPRAPRSQVVARRSILVIEPDADLGRRMQQTLAADYQVTIVSSSLVGLRNVLETGRFDLVVCDLMALEVSGLNLFDSLAELGTGLDRLALTSEHVGSPRASRFLEESGGPWLRKPFRDSDLLGFVRARCLA